MKLLGGFAFLCLLCGVAGYGFAPLLGAPAPAKATPPRTTVCVTDSEVLTPPKGSDGMRLKTTSICRDQK